MDPFGDFLDDLPTQVNVEEFIRQSFEPADNLADASLTLTTNQVITLLENNFSYITVESVSKALQDLEFKQQYFDGDMVWLMKQKN